MLRPCGSRHVIGIAALGASLLLPATSLAHFYLESPPAATEQDALGDPQKAPPCGDNGNAVATNLVTTYQAGSTITVTIDERIFHPGHYRIALAVDDISELPPPAPVTPGSTPCGSAPIQDPPVFPVLADGVFEHTEQFSEPQTIEIKLPDDVTCTNCTLQVIQFMSDHVLNDPGGCYYHHCATIALESDPVEGTSTSGDDTAGMTDGGNATTATSMTTASSADGSTGIGDTGDDAGNGSGAGDGGAGTSAIAETDPGQSEQESEKGCACALQGGGSGGGFALLLGSLGILGLGVRRPRAKNGSRTRSTPAA